MMSFEELRQLAEDVAGSPAVGLRLTEEQRPLFDQFIDMAGTIHSIQWQRYQRDKTMSLKEFCSFVFHEGLQTGLKLSLENGELKRR